MAKPKAHNDYHRWRFVTNHAHVLETVAGDPTIRMRDIAVAVGITERTAAQIVSELEHAGYLTRSRNGRRNHYQVHANLPLRHPRHRHHTVGELIRFLRAPPRTFRKPRSTTKADDLLGSAHADLALRNPLRRTES